ncbi:MAG: hypothetical protein ACREFE_13995 [Limisphaerales bacterium]
MTIKFHINVETQGAVAVGSSAVLGGNRPNLTKLSAKKTSDQLNAPHLLAPNKSARAGNAAKNVCRSLTEKQTNQNAA